MGLRRTWIVALPAVALAITGCGGGGGSDSSESTATGAATAGGAATATSAEETSGALTKAELIEQGEAICAKANSAVGSVNPDSPDATARVAGLYGDMLTSLESLGRPQEAEAAYGEYLKTSGELATALNELKLASEGDSSNLKAEEKKAEGALNAFLLNAGKYGFKECSQGPGAPSESTAPGAEGGEGESPGVESGGVESEVPIELVPEEAG